MSRLGAYMSSVGYGNYTSDFGDFGQLESQMRWVSRYMQDKHPVLKDAQIREGHTISYSKLFRKFYIKDSAGTTVRKGMSGRVDVTPPGKRVLFRAGPNAATAPIVAPKPAAGPTAGFLSTLLTGQPAAPAAPVGTGTVLARPAVRLPAIPTVTPVEIPKGLPGLPVLATPKGGSPLMNVILWIGGIGAVLYLGAMIFSKENQ